MLSSKHALSILGICFSLFMSAQWTQRTSNTTHDLRDLHFLDDHHAYVVGDSGTVKFSADAGIYWNDRSLPSKPNIFSVYFTHVATGWIATETGLWKTLDAAQSWQLVPGTDTLRPLEVFFTDSLHGFVGTYYGQMLSTTDAGQSWNIQNSGLFSQIQCIQFPTPQFGYAVGSGPNQFIKTTDGGNSWNAYVLDTAVATSLTAIDFPSPQIGFVGAWLDPVLMKTTDGGQNWTHSDTNGLKVFDLDFPSEQVGYGASPYGQIHMTLDGGTTWQTQQVAGPNTTMNSIQFYDERNGIAVGFDGTILTTTNGGGALSTEENFETPLTVFPNPTTEELHIQTSNGSSASWEIIDLSGRIHVARVISQDNEFTIIDVSELPSGWYHLQNKMSLNEKSSFIKE